MNETAFERFIALVEHDQQFLLLGTEREHLIKEKNNIENTLENLESRKDHLYRDFVSLRKKVNAIELELKVVFEQEQRTTKRLENAHTPKEYFSLEQELTDIQKKKKAQEDILWSSWAELEQAQKLYEHMMQEIPKLIEAVQYNLKNILRRIETADKHLQENIQTRPSMQHGVMPELLEHYNAMRQKVSNPVIPEKRKSCSACFYTLSNQDMQDIKHKKLVTCKECYRFLYMQAQDSNL